MIQSALSDSTFRTTDANGGNVRRIVNDFSIQVATVNGSGSQTANNVLMRSIFQMGVPVSGKNIFPSNIAGLPTWFTIRANKDGYIARKKKIDILIAMNPETIEEDIKGLLPGAVVIYNSDLKFTVNRNDLTYYPIPFNKLVQEGCPNAEIRKLVVNMIYVGVASELFKIEYAEVEKALLKQFKSKQKAIELNLGAVKIGIDYVRKNIVKKDPYYVERMNKTVGKIIIEGNASAALGAMFAGCTVFSWYPITPSSSLGEALTEYFKKYRTDKTTGKATYAVVQAEDELAAIGMALGAGWAGARSMTATSGPGISLMAEFAGLGYYAEVPAVIYDVQRVGPSTGLPTRTAQGDILEVAFLSHGDTKHIMLFPATVEECYTMTFDAFNLAERFQTPVFVMSDLDLGMNNWMSAPFNYINKPLDRGKVLTVEQLEKIGKFERYRDVDGDGIPYRTLPGVRHPFGAYFTRGSGHNEKAQYSEKSQDYKNIMDRLARKFETARSYVPAPIEDINPKAEIGIIAFGTTHHAIRECRDQLRVEHSIQTSYLRICAYPFNDMLEKFISLYKRVYVVEQNRDGQMRQLINQDVGGECIRTRSVLHYTGIPIDARFITDDIVAQESGKTNTHQEVKSVEGESSMVGGE